jgi:hypothetical protein
MISFAFYLVRISVVGAGGCALSELPVGKSIPFLMV